MIVSNLNNVAKFLKQELADESKITRPLTVESIGSDYVVVASSHDSDLSIKLRGITDVAVGATLAVAIDSGEVTIMSAPEATPKTAMKRIATPRTPSASFDPNKYL